MLYCMNESSAKIFTSNFCRFSPLANWEIRFGCDWLVSVEKYVCSGYNRAKRLLFLFIPTFIFVLNRQLLAIGINY